MIIINNIKFRYKFALNEVDSLCTTAHFFEQPRAISIKGEKQPKGERINTWPV